MSFGIKEQTEYTDKDRILLSHIRLILDVDCPLLLSVREDYRALTEASNSYERIACTIIAAIILQERLYFALSRDSLRRLLASDPNLGKHRATFSNKQWPSILSFLYNNLKLIKMIQPGTTRTAAIYEVTNSEIIQYLTSKIDTTKQREESLAFGLSK